MTKPINMSTKDWLVSVTAKELEMDEALCNKVVSWAYLKTKEATDDNRSIEISGFGKLLLAKAKVARRIKNIRKAIVKFKNNLETATPERQTKLQKSIEGGERNIEILKNRMPEYEF